MSGAEAFHPSDFIQDELDARGWTLGALAIRMGGDCAINLLMLDLYMHVGPSNPGLRIGRDCAAQLALAFDVSADLFINLETIWLAAAQERRAMNYPEGAHLSAPGGPHERALTPREVRRKDREALAGRCGRLLGRAEGLLARLEDSDNGDTIPRLEALAERLEAAVVAGGGRVG